MVVYIDFVFLINFIFDATLLYSVDTLLKRNVSIWRILLGALLGEISMISLFIDIDNNTLKIALSTIMCLATFSYKNFRYTLMNIIYLYLGGTILGGFEYYLFNEFQIGSTLSIKYLIVLILSPLVLFIYNILEKNIKNDYNNRHKIKILYGDSLFFEGTGYLDSGNSLICPITGKKIILVEKEYILYHKLKVFPVPYNALNHHGLIYCFTPKCTYVDDREYDDLLVGLSENAFHIDGVNVLLNSRMEDL